MAGPSPSYLLVMVILVCSAEFPLLTFMVLEGLAVPNSGENEEPFTVTTLPLASTPKVAPEVVGVAEVRFVKFRLEVFAELAFISRLVPGVEVPMPTFPMRCMAPDLLLPASIVPPTAYQAVLAGGL